MYFVERIIMPIIFLKRKYTLKKKKKELIRLNNMFLLEIVDLMKILRVWISF